MKNHLAAPLLISWLPYRVLSASICVHLRLNILFSEEGPMKIQRWLAAAMLVAVVMLGGVALRAVRAQNTAHDDVEQTNQGPVTIRPLVHGSVLLEFQGKAYYIDPSGNYAWDSLPKADLILITHEHGDHLSPTVV